MLIRFKKNDGSEYPQWEINKFIKVYSCSQGVQVDLDNQYKKCDTGMERFIRVIDVTQGEEPPRYISNESKKGHVEVDDLFFVRYGAVGTIGYGYKGTIANNLFRLDKKIDINNKFMFYQFIAPNFNKKLKALNASTSMPAINFSALNKLNVYIPASLEEQKKIADFLSTVDQKIEKQKAMVADYERLKKGTMKKIFNQEIRFKDDCGNEFPEWEEHKLSNIVNFRRGNGLSWDNITESGVNKCILYGNLYTEYKEVIKQIVFFTNENPTDCVVSRKGEVLIPASDTTATGLARASCIMLDGVILGGDINILTPKIEIMGEYLSYCINANKKQLIRIIQGSTVRHLKNEDIAKIKLFISPSIEEQKKIADCLSTLDKKIESEKKILADLEELKKGLLQGIFNN